MRARLAVFALLALAPATTVLGEPVDACGDARAAFLAAWDGDLSQDDAPLLRDLVEACPAVQASALPGESALGVAQAAAQCGFQAGVSVSAEDAPIYAWVQLAGRTFPEEDAGPATVTFDPGASLTEYAATGRKWGVTANDRGMGAITLYGVPIPVTPSNGVAQANGHCTFTWRGAVLCGGDGYAMANLGGLGAVSVLSEFSRCHEVV